MTIAIIKFIWKISPLLNLNLNPLTLPYTNFYIKFIERKFIHEIILTRCDATKNLNEIIKFNNVIQK